MKALYRISTIFFLGWVSFAAADENLKGHFECKTKSIDIYKFEDGTLRKFKGWNSHSVGDQTTLSYSFSKSIYNSAWKDLSIGTPITDFPFFALAAMTKNDEITIFDDGNIRVNSGMSKFYLSDDYLSVETNVVDDVSRLTMRRYFKNDWEAILTSSSHSSSKTEGYILAMNCRHQRDVIDDIITQIKQYR